MKINEERMGIKGKIRKEKEGRTIYSNAKVKRVALRRVTLFIRLCNYFTGGITKKKKAADVIENICIPTSSSFQSYNSKLRRGMDGLRYRNVVHEIFLLRPISLLRFFFDSIDCVSRDTKSRKYLRLFDPSWMR